MFVLLGFVLIIIGFIEVGSGDMDTAWKALTLGNIFLIIFYISDLKRDIINFEKRINEKLKNSSELGVFTFTEETGSNGEEN